MANSKEQFEYLLKYTGRDQSEYDNIIGRIDQALSIEGKARTEALKAVYMEIFRNLYRDSIAYRLNIGDDVKNYKPGFEPKRVSGQQIMMDFTSAFGNYCEEKIPNSFKNDATLGMTIEERRDLIVTVGNEFKALGYLENSGKTRNISSLLEDLGVLESTVEKSANSGTPYAFTHNLKLSTNASFAEQFISYEARREAYKEKSGLWKFFHPIQAYRHNRYFNRMEKLFEKIGFTPDEHRDTIRNHFANSPHEVTKAQIDLAEDKYKRDRSAQERAEKLKNIPQITDAADKAKKATELNKNPLTSFKSKVSDLVAKYDLDKGSDSLTFESESYKANANKFDTERDMSSIKANISISFLSAYRKMILSSLQKNGTVNIKEVLNDAHKYAMAELQHYTVVYEHPDAAAFLKEAAFGTVSIKGLQNKAASAINYYNGTKGIAAMTDEQKNALNSDIAEVVNEHQTNRDKYIEQEKAMMGKVEDKKIEEPKKEEIKPVANGDQFFRIDYRPTAKNLDEQILQINEVSRSIKGKAISADAKAVFIANQSKIKELKYHVQQKSVDGQFNGDALDQKWNDREQALKNTYPDYKPQTAEEIRSTAPDKQPISVDLGEKKNDEIAIRKLPSDETVRQVSFNK